VAERVLAELGGWLAAAGKIIAHVPPVTGYSFQLMESGRTFSDTDAALESCEDGQLQRAGVAASVELATNLGDVDILRAMEAKLVERLVPYLELVHFRMGQVVARQGAPADRLFFVVRGRCDVQITTDAGRPHRVGTVVAGEMIGEGALFAAGQRTADIVARTDVSSFVLTRTRFLQMLHDDPQLCNALLLEVGRRLTVRLGQANAEIRALTH
jgi:CRP-like cAMP-binding protein